MAEFLLLAGAMGNALRHLDQLSIWEVAHRWVGVDPDATESLPEPVRDWLRKIVVASDNYLHVLDTDGCRPGDEPRRLPLLFLLASGDRRCKALYKILMAASQDRVFRKAELDRLYVDRDEVMVWCLRAGMRLPSFWWDAEEVERCERMRPQYGPPLEEVEARNNEPPQTTDCPEVANGMVGCPGTATGASYESLQRLAARARHEPVNRLKRNFIRFRVGGNGRSDRDAAQRFYDRLPAEEQRLLSPGNAVQTLTTAITTYKKKPKGKPAEWLAGFDPSTPPE